MSYHLRRRGLRGIATGYPTASAFEAAICDPLYLASKKCPPPFDPACVDPLNAAWQNCANQWTLDPTSCGNIVCDASGKPIVTQQAYTTAAGQAATGCGYNTVTGFVLAPCPGETSIPAGSPAPAKFAYPLSLPPPMAYTPAPGPYQSPTPIQSASPATAPGGTAAPAGSPTPVQTQAPAGPVDTSATPIVLASACGAGQSYVAPGQAYQYPPYAGQISSNGACETIPIGGAVLQDMTGTVAVPTAASLLSSIPLWGWAVGGLAVLLIATSGGK